MLHRKSLLVALATLVTIGLSTSEGARESGWKAGFARVDITPDDPIFLLGYSSRKGPFEQVEQPIYAKALALEDSEGYQAVLVTTDLVGVQDPVFGPVCKRIEEETGLLRNRILLNASHTHTGPLVSLDPVRDANIAYAAMSPEDASRTVAYTKKLQDRVVELVKDALKGLAPAKLSWGAGEVGFVMNRRVVESGRIAMGPNPDGIRDSVVPVLRLENPEGELRGVLFGCACHNTTLTDKHNLICGDYAGFAQQYVRENHPGAEAMFLIGCGADANPEPRGEMEMARGHGRELANEVERVLSGSMKPVQGPLRTSYAVTELPLRDLSKQDLEFIANLPSSEALMAKQMLAVRNEGADLPRIFPAPFAVWRFGEDLTLVGLPGEPVAEYVPLVKGRLPDKNLWIAGYNNHCFGYLPTRRIIEEGGHENIGVTLWIWGKNLSDRVGFFDPETEEVALNAVKDLWKETSTSRP